MRGFVTVKKQKGVVLFFALIALVVILFASVALIRSTDTASLIAGNLSVKRDLANQGEAGLAAAWNSFSDSSGNLHNIGPRRFNMPAANYSAVFLASNTQGIPNVLLDDSLFAANFSQADTTLSSGIKYRYVIDRMCPATGAPNNSTNSCITGQYTCAGCFTMASTPATIPSGPVPGLPKGTVVYRISVRVTDAKQTQSFLQTTFQGDG
ncbi:MAG: hypothetical protein JSS16_11455 [Proteobacteria bacterium]|nr:hypothetical protein [Pseudomonadota bacterium]